MTAVEVGQHEVRGRRRRAAVRAGAVLLLAGLPAAAAAASGPADPVVVMASSRFLPGDSCLVREGKACVRVAEPLTVQEGSSLQALNADAPRHDLRSVALHPSTGRPLFSSPLLSLGQSAPVAGVADLDPGLYGYYCSLHPPAADGTGMRGVLRVVESGVR